MLFVRKANPSNIPANNINQKLFIFAATNDASSPANNVSESKTSRCSSLALPRKNGSSVNKAVAKMASLLSKIKDSKYITTKLNISCTKTRLYLEKV